jgi:trehalose/maltose hydrolase-like predicted phosphorylase
VSKVVHASVLDRIDRSRAWDMFRAALESDITDVQGGTTPEGIHLGAMAGTVDIVLRHYGGIDTTSEVIAFYPRLPAPLHELQLRLRHRGQWYELSIDDERFTLSIDEDGSKPLTVTVQGKRLKLKPGTTHKFLLTVAKAKSAGRAGVKASVKVGRAS